MISIHCIQGLCHLLLVADVAIEFLKILSIAVKRNGSKLSVIPM